MEILPSNNIIDNQRDTSIIQKKMENLVEEDDKKLMEVCKEFESVFIHMMLKEMKKTVPAIETVEAVIPGVNIKDKRLKGKQE